MKKTIITFSEWDSSHFNLRVAKAFPKMLADIDDYDRYIVENNIDLLITRCDVSDMEIIHKLLNKRHILMDSLVRYKYDFEKKPTLNMMIDENIRVATEADLDEIISLTHDSFSNYSGHFHNDPKLDRETSTSLYVEWAKNSLDGVSLADGMFVYDGGTGVEGFITVKKLDQYRSDGVLACVAPKSQGKGIYRKLIEYIMSWSVENGFKIMELGPLLDNYAVQRVWQRLGFEIYTATHTFHKWLDIDKK